MKILAAAWIAPMSSPIFRDGAIAIAEGKIVAVGDAGKIRSEYPGAEMTDLGDSILLPGLINPHTHLELSDCTPRGSSADSFTDWILTMRQRIGAGDFAAATRAGIAQCLRFGITTVGDITQQIQITRPILAASPLRAISFGEVLGLAKRRFRFDELLPQAIDREYETDRMKIGLSPHAPYTVDLDGYKQCMEIAKTRAIPIATHLAENPGESSFLTDHAGPFRDLWNTLGSWEDPVPTYRGSPIEMANLIGLLKIPTVLAHVNYCTEEEMNLLATGSASVIYCPRTHAYFKHPPHRWRDMLDRGINVAIGTDSCASSPDLNLLDDLRLLRTLAPDLPAQSIWQLATTRAARALSMQNEIGSLTYGKEADLISFRAIGDDPLEAILQTNIVPTSVWIGGQQVMRDGR